MSEYLFLMEENAQSGVEPVGAVLKGRVAGAREDEEFGAGGGAVDAGGFFDAHEVLIAGKDPEASFNPGEVGDNKDPGWFCPYFMAFFRNDGPMRGNVGGDAILRDAKFVGMDPSAEQASNGGASPPAARI